MSSCTDAFRVPAQAMAKAYGFPGFEFVGKEAVSKTTRWRLPASHPEAMPDQAQASEHPDLVPALTSPAAVLIAVAGANNAGVSAVVEMFGPRGGPPAVVRIPDGPDGPGAHARAEQYERRGAV